MPGPNKRTRKPDNADSESSSDGEESDSGTYHGQKEIQATFEGRNPEGQDYHGIKQLLQQLFLKAQIDVSQMSDLLIAQTGVGSVLKQSLNDSDDDDDSDMVDDFDVFAITSVLRLTAHRDLPTVQQFYKLIEELTDKHTVGNTQQELKRIVADSQRLGLILNERFVNIPAKISSVMLQSLFEEIEKKKKKDDSYNFDNFVMICKTSKPKGVENGEEIFTNDEELLFSEAADVTFDFNVEDAVDTALGGRWTTEDQQLVPYRRIVVFNAKKFKNIIEDVTAFVNG